MRVINKIPIFEWFYEQGDVYITILIGGSDLLNIPQRFYEHKTETFVVGGTPTPELTYDEKGISTSMWFGNKNFNCFFPWECITIMSGPNAVIEFIAEEKPKKETSYVKPGKMKYILTKKKKSTRDRSHLKVVK